MHYSPLASGAGLFILWHAFPAGSVTGVIARILIDIAGLAFLAILMLALFANLYGALRTGPARPRRYIGRHSARAARAPRRGRRAYGSAL